METLSKSESRRLYSWWWDSHNSPKNSKWLQENLTDMDSKVKAMIKLIEEDADSFARRAEMYYKKRPELMKLVEEFYRAYRALAERYDHATAELRQAHRTMAKAFPNQVPFILPEDSPSSTTAYKAEPQTPEMPHPICASLDRDELQKGIVGISIQESNAEIGKKGLKFDEMEETERTSNDEISQLSNENRNLKNKVLSELERAVKAESEVQNLQKAFDAMKDEKKSILLHYNQTLEKISDLEEELNFTQRKSTKIDEQASKAENEVLSLKEAIRKLEAEVDDGSLKQKEYIYRIYNLESMISRAQENAEGLNERTVKAEVETECLKRERSRLETEKEVHFLQYKQCLANISELEGKLALAESEVKLLSERADRAEREVKKLGKALAELKEQKEDLDLLYKDCLEKIAMLEREISCAREDAKRLNSEISIGAEKLKKSEEKHALLQTSNQSLRLEAENLVNKIAVKDQELLEKHEELEKLRICLQNEKFQFVQIETHLQTLHNLHSKSQSEQRDLTLELKNVIQMLKDLEIRKHDLELENQRLNELNSSSTGSMINLQNQIISLREMKKRLEEEVELQMGISNDLQKEIFLVKSEIKNLNIGYETLMESVKDLEDENSDLKRKSKKEKDEKEGLLETNATLESSLSNLNGELEVFREKMKTFQVDKCSVVAEKASLLSQLQMVTETMVKLFEKNTVLENSLSSANVKLEDLREKSKSLEDMCHVLKNEESNLLTERNTLIIQLENVEKRLENLEKKFTELEGKHDGLEKEKDAKHSEIEELRFSLGIEKKDRESFTQSSDTRLASLENRVHLLQEESKWKKKEFEEEIQKIMNTQFEIFILKKFIQEMEEKNYSLLIECEKHVEASKLGEKLISELERENLEQQVEAELLFDETEKLKLGLFRVFKALEIDINKGCKEKIENEETSIHRMVQTIAEMKRSLSSYKDEKQRMWVENLVLVTTLEQLRWGFSKIVSGKEILCQKLEDEFSKVLVENRSLLIDFSDLEEEKRLVDEENELILLETLAFGNLSVIFKSLWSEKVLELKALGEYLHNLEGKLKLSETENLQLKDSVEKLGKELCEVRDVNDQLREENLSGEDFLRRKETEIERLCEVNGNLVSELDTLHEEIEEHQIIEENLNSELQEQRNEFELWEDEASTFYFDLQMSSIHEVFFENKVHELSGVCKSLEDEEASKNVEIEQMRERIGFMEREIGGLKSQLFAYTPLIASMRENVESLQQNSFFQAKFDGADIQKAKVEELAVHLCGKSFKETTVDENSVVPNGISDLKELQIRIKAIEKTVIEKMEEMEELKSQCRSDQQSYNQKEEKELEHKFDFRKRKPEISELRNGILMKDIPLDQVSEGLLNQISRRGSGGTHDQLLDLRGTSEEDCAHHQTINEMQKQAFEDLGEKEKDLGIDKLEVSRNVKEPTHEGNKRKILLRLASDAQRLTGLKSTVENLKRKLEGKKKKSRKEKGVDFETVNEQLQEFEETIVEMVDMNGKLMKNVEDEKASEDLEFGDVQRKRITEQARKGSEKLGRLQLEVQKIEYVLLKFEDEKKSKTKNRFSKTRTSIILRDFIRSGRQSSERKRKARLCGCWRPSSTGGGNNM